MTNAAQTFVALIGRPNVGKSTLFNRITRRRDALVDPTPGVTRDRHYARVTWEEHAFTIVDTGGIDDDDDTITRHIREQALQAIDEADVILFLMDGRQGLTAHDAEIVALLRRTEKPVLFVVNKIDSPEMESEVLGPFYELGMDKLWAVSAEHGYGFRTLMEGLVPLLSEAGAEDKLPENTIRLAFIGRPNVGKSSLINAIIGEERMVVSEISGTTRDSVDHFVSQGQHNYLLIDTAGIRRRGKTKDKIEKFSVLKSLKSLDRCDIAIVVIDAIEGITEQDARIIGYTQDEGRALIMLINKWDLIKDDRKRQNWLMKEMEIATAFVAFAPIFKVSAVTGQGLPRLFPEIGKINRQFRERFPTSSLNRLLEDAVAQHQPPMHRDRRLKFYYTAQIGTAPPTFAVITSHPKAVHVSYQRYLTNRFREGLGLDKVPVRLFFKERSGRTKK